MENSNKKKISLEEIYPTIKASIDNGGSVELPITGTSMLPLLVWGRDTVTIKKCENANRGDIIFYRRDDGHFVLHRVVDKNDNGYVICGDNQVVKEYGICDNHIIAVVTDITRKGKTFSVNKLSYKIYSKLWTAILPFRNVILVPIRKVKRLFK